MSQEKERLLSSSPARAELCVKGMTCSSCTSIIENVVGNTDGVHSVNVNLVTEQAVVEFDPAVTTVEALAEQINDVCT